MARDFIRKVWFVVINKKISNGLLVIRNDESKRQISSLLGKLNSCSSLSIRGIWRQRTTARLAHLSIFVWKKDESKTRDTAWQSRPHLWSVQKYQQIIPPPPPPPFLITDIYTRVPPVYLGCFNMKLIENLLRLLKVIWLLVVALLPPF